MLPGDVRGPNTSGQKPSIAYFLFQSVISTIAVEFQETWEIVWVQESYGRRILDLERLSKWVYGTLHKSSAVLS